MLMRAPSDSYTNKPLDNERNDEWSRLLEMINPAPPQFAPDYPKPFKAPLPQMLPKVKDL